MSHASSLNIFVKRKKSSRSSQAKEKKRDMSNKNIYNKQPISFTMHLKGSEGVHVGFFCIHNL